MKILIDAHMVGEGETGNETYTANLIRALSEGNYPDTFLLATTSASALEEHVPLGKQFRAVPVSSSPLRRLLVELPRIARQEQADLMHVTYAGPPYGSCPVVTSIHDVSFRRNPEWFSPRDRLVLRLGVGSTVKRASRVLAISNHARDEIRHFYGVPRERIAVSYLAAPPRFRPRDEEVAPAWGRYGISTPYVLAVGNLQPRKNLTRLIQAYARMKSGLHVAHQLVLVGRARWQQSALYEEVKRHRLESDILFTGYVPEDDLPALYRGANLFVYPSLYEGFGLPILEAMACGTPVITSNASSMPEVAGEAAILVDPLRVDDIARAMTSVLTDDALRRVLGEKGLQQNQTFSWKTTAEETHKVYREVAGRGLAVE